MSINDLSRTQPSPEVVGALLLRIGAVMRLTGLGRSTIYRLMAEEQFPSPVRLTKRVVAWRRSELEQWSNGRPKVTH
jgi:prophage regulatory protein